MSLQSRISDLITAIGTDIKQHRTWITGSASGDLTGLDTDAKTSVVAAINEVHGQLGSGAPDASETVKGIAELATLAEVATGTDTTRIVTPAGVRQEVGDRTTLATTVKTSLVAAVNELHGEVGSPPDASETVKGIIEIATLAEVGTGTDSTRAVTAAGVKQETDAVKAAILDSAPTALDTLNELAAALGDDANFASTVTTALAGKQPLDSDLTAIAGLTSAADKAPYSTGAGTWALADFTSAGRALLDDLDAAAQRTTLSVYSQTELGNPDTDLAALYTTAKT